MHDSVTNSAMPDPTDVPVDVRQLRVLRRNGLLDDTAFHAALGRIGANLAWGRWANRALLFIGTSLVLAGIVFFFAYNWGRLPSVAKFGVLETGLWACAVGAWWKGLQRLEGKVLLSAACVLVGVLLAVYGQVYQTGADDYQLFVAWALLILPWVVIGEFAALWLLWLVLANVAVALAWIQLVPRSSSWWFWNEAGACLILGGLNAVALAAIEFAVARGKRWLAAKWLRWIVCLAAITNVTIPMLVFIVETHVDHGEPVVLPIWLATLAASFMFYRFRAPDLFVLGTAATSVCVVILTAVGRAVLDGPGSEAGFLVVGTLALVLFGGAGTWLRSVHRRLPRENTNDAAPAADSPHPTATSMSCCELLGELRSAGLLTEPKAAQIAERLRTASQTASDPWYVHALLAIGAWIAALCVLGFIGCASALQHVSTRCAIGLMAIPAGIGLRRSTAHTFVAQLALAASVIGQVLLATCVVEGVTDHSLQLAYVVLLSTALTVVLYPLFPDPLHRFLTCLATIGLITYWICDQHLEQLLHVEMLANVVGLGIVFLYRSEWPALRPIGFAMALATVGNMFLGFNDHFFAMPWWPANIVACLGLLWLYWHIAAGRSPTESPGWEPVVMAAAATIVLSFVTTPGVLVALGLLILGHYQRERMLVALGGLFFPVFVVMFYYEMHVSLLTKSYLLAASGGLLLLGREYLKRRPWAGEMAT